MTKTHEFKGEVLTDGRKRVVVTRLNAPVNAYNPASYTTVRNIDGSNRLMADNGLWDFLPNEYADAAGAAIAAAELRPYGLPHMVPTWAAIA